MPPAIDNKLTNRQREILQLIAQGKTQEGVANILYISRSTVQTTMKNTLERLGVHNAAAKAIRAGYIA